MPIKIALRASVQTFVVFILSIHHMAMKTYLCASALINP